MAKKAAGGTSKSETSKSETSKSELIRNYKDSHNGAGPTEIAAALTKEGAKVTPQFVSTVLSNDKRKNKRKGGNGRRGGKRRGGRRPAGDVLQTLVQAKKLADQMGGIDKARAALDALSKILG